MTQKIRIYSLSVKYCKEIFDRKLFTLVEFKEDEFGKWKVCVYVVIDHEKKGEVIEKEIGLLKHLLVCIGVV